MKLKLEKKGETQVLFVSETIAPQEVAILKAGVTKISSTAGTKDILLDLTAVKDTPAEVLKEIVALKSIAVSNKVLLMIASTAQGVGDAPTLDEALKKFASPLARLLETEARLQTKFKQLQERKTALDKQFEAISKSGDDIKSAQKENSTLNAQVHTLEELVKTFVKERTADPVSTDIIGAKYAEVVKILNITLEQQNLIRKK